MTALKAQWLVTAQLIPSERSPEEPAKMWAYLSDDYEADSKLLGGRFGEGSRFRILQAEAHALMAELQLGGWNVVHCEYVWL